MIKPGKTQWGPGAAERTAEEPRKIWLTTQVNRGGSNIPSPTAFSVVSVSWWRSSNGAFAEVRMVG